VKKLLLIYFITVLFLSHCSTDPVVYQERRDDDYFVFCLLYREDDPTIDPVRNTRGIGGNIDETMCNLFHNRFEYQKYSFVYLQRILFLTDLATSRSSDDFGIEGADVRIYTPDSVIVLADSGNGFYFMPIFARQGEHYRLEIKTPDGSLLSSETTIQDIPNSTVFSGFSQGDTLWVTADSIGPDYRYNLNRFKHSNPTDIYLNPLPENIYFIGPWRWSSSVDHPPFFNSGIEYQSDEGERSFIYCDIYDDIYGINNNSISLRGFSRNPSNFRGKMYPDAFFNLYFCDLGFYLAIRLMENTEDPDALQKYSNIEGGYGVFGSFPKPQKFPFVLAIRE